MLRGLLPGGVPAARRARPRPVLRARHADGVHLASRLPQPRRARSREHRLLLRPAVEGTCRDHERSPGRLRQRAAAPPPRARSRGSSSAGGGPRVASGERPRRRRRPALHGEPREHPGVRPAGRADFAAYRAAGAREAGVLVTLDVPNNFPRLPIRTDGPHLLWLGIAENDDALATRFGPLVERSARRLMATGLLRGSPELIVLDPTSRSRLR